MDDSRIRSKTAPFSFENGLVRTGPKMVMTSDETQIQILANWPMSHAKRVTRDNWKNPEYHVVAAIR